VNPKILVHGHIHAYGENRPDRTMGSITVVNAVGY
jgi:Icc-related predicted phosphoesterase